MGRQLRRMDQRILWVPPTWGARRSSGYSSFAARIIGEVSPRLVVGDTKHIRTLAHKVPTLSFEDLDQLLPATTDFTIDPSVAADTPFQIIFTSGTTSEPKGIVHTHGNVLASLRPIETEIAKYRRYERWVHPLRFLHTLPLSHVFGQFMGLWVPALLAAELHFTDSLESGRMIQNIRRERISVLIAVPRIQNLLRSHLFAENPSLRSDLEDAGGLSMLKRWWRFRAVHNTLGWTFWAVLSGGAALPDQLELFWNRIGIALIQGYDMTETAALITLNHPFHIGRGTIGKVLPGREVRLSETGELLVRGDMVAGATWHDGELRKREGGWLATGDLAERNAAGELLFMGRKGDTIISSSGMNIFAADLEAAMKKQPGVQDCAVVPCEFASGPEPVCVVQFNGEDSALHHAVRQANRELSEYQHIRRVLRWPEFTFPYTSTGKLLRRVIRDWACSMFADKPLGAQPTDSLLRMISSITSEPSPAGADTLHLAQDLHLDSLVRVQLASLIEQSTGVEINDSQMATLETLGQLRQLIAAAAPTSSPNAPPISNRQSLSTPFALPAPHPAAEPSRYVYPRWPWSAPVQSLRSLFLEAVVRPLIGFCLVPRIVHSQPTLPRGPLLIIANHVTVLDGPLVLYALPPALRRRVAIAMSGEMLLDYRSGKASGAAHGFPGRASYWLLSALFNVFPLPRLQGFRQSFAHVGEAMDRGYSVLVFPEGTRSRSSEIASFRQGIGLLTTQSGVPVLPVALVGLDDLRTRRVPWFRRQTR